MGGPFFGPFKIRLPGGRMKASARLHFTVCMKPIILVDANIIASRVAAVNEQLHPCIQICTSNIGRLVRSEAPLQSVKVMSMLFRSACNIFQSSEHSNTA